MVRPTSLLKRLLVGRPVRSDRLHHTLLPKRIALPVFASDPMSSVAYAPAQILLTLSIGGLAASTGAKDLARYDRDLARGPVRGPRFRAGRPEPDGDRPATGSRLRAARRRRM